ncbi:hypothetical protein GUITHDRAFT_142075 [Guillardia theta CCMP2712]|uniref:Uncharacterized protein n=1 Tax=Guillardia theta (strain CCMP2712) TaxID=905079 RepID=L1IZY1_GUITC|nr:hypothetical protein GUITHDRAFT_142075 [Guillardia theta CCMP2712]EKX41385.1 hypothetical protein GUITHDRAFT_142075 [Guillardia theta CCMP2712]|eukprot:XP_005828365.1 hypothetical protein GUITHDRAFT_142075 [Guillardia theta CCMP2712]
MADWSVEQDRIAVLERSIEELEGSGSVQSQDRLQLLETRLNRMDSSSTMVVSTTPPMFQVDGERPSWMSLWPAPVTRTGGSQRSPAKICRLPRVEDCNPAVESSPSTEPGYSAQASTKPQPAAESPSRVLMSRAEKRMESPARSMANLSPESPQPPSGFAQEKGTSKILRQVTGKVPPAQSLHSTSSEVRPAELSILEQVEMESVSNGDRFRNANFHQIREKFEQVYPLNGNENFTFTDSTHHEFVQGSDFIYQGAVYSMPKNDYSPQRKEEEREGHVHTNVSHGNFSWSKLEKSGLPDTFSTLREEDRRSSTPFVMTLEQDYDNFIPESERDLRILKKKISFMIANALGIESDRMIALARVEIVEFVSGSVEVKGVLYHAVSDVKGEEAQLQLERLRSLIDLRSTTLSSHLNAVSISFTSSTPYYPFRDNVPSEPYARPQDPPPRSPVGPPGVKESQRPQGLLEVFILRASALPTQEWTKAVCVVELESSSRAQGFDKWRSGKLGDNRRSEILSSLDAFISQRYQRLHGTNDGEALLSSLLPLLCSQEPREPPAWMAGRHDDSDFHWQDVAGHQTFRTCVRGGDASPKWSSACRFAVLGKRTDRLRLQVLHLGSAGSELVGMVTIEAREWREEGGGKEKQEEAETAPEVLTFHDGLKRNERVVCKAYPLRSITGERIEDGSGKESILYVGLRWTEEVSKQLVPCEGTLQELVKGEGKEAMAWRMRFYQLDPFTQVLWRRDGEQSEQLKIRNAEIKSGGRRDDKLLFEICTRSSSVKLGAETEEDRTRWVESLRASSGLPYRSRGLRNFMLALALLVLLLAGGGVGIGIVAWKNAHRPQVPSYMRWESCKGGDCEACACFQRCLFGSTLGLQASLGTAPHNCSSSCSCSLRAPYSGCGNGVLQARSTVRWFGEDVFFTEECDDGNVVSGDGCSSSCKIESFMKTEAYGLRVAGASAAAKSLCGRNNHTLSVCEEACLRSSSCGCMWFGDGYCHLYAACNTSRIPALSDIEGTWDEVEFQCGLNNFVVDQQRVEIRSEVALFGYSSLSSDQLQTFKQSFSQYCSAPCRITVLSVTAGATTVVRREQQARQATSDKLVVVAFKFTASASSSSSLVTSLTSYLNLGDSGLLGSLKQLGLSSLTGVTVRPAGLPQLFPSPAPPNSTGTLYKKEPYHCTTHNLVGENQYDNTSLCCGNRSEVCQPVGRCYVSLERNFECVPNALPYQPTAPFIEGNSQWDGQPFFSPGASTSVCVTRLTNFIPWYFRVSARNKLGYGSFSSLTRDSMPWVAASDPPTSLIAHAGNRQVWLSWTAPAFDGGRPIASYAVEIAHDLDSSLLCGDPHGCSSTSVPWGRKDPRPVAASFTWQQVPSEGLAYGSVPPDRTYPISSSSPQQDSLLVKTRAEDVPNCHLPPPPVVLTTFLVKTDAQGNPLMNNYKYHFRIRAYNNFQLSLPSTNLSLFPVGRVPYQVQGFNASCYESREWTSCTVGYSGDTRIPITWNPPADDGGMDVTGYHVEYSLDAGATWTEHVAQSKQDARTTSYMLPCMLNDKPYLLRVRAINLYGEGDPSVIGPVTPRWCPHMQACGVCLEPNYELWGGCSLPACSSARSGLNTRFINCTGGGCRVEVLHAGVWGGVSGFFTNSSGDVACHSLGLRPRPQVCGGPTCGSVQLSSSFTHKKIWLTNLSCSGSEASLLDCPSNVTMGNVTVSEVGDEKFALSTQEGSSFEVCCWDTSELFSTISVLDRQGEEQQPDFCCQVVGSDCLPAGRCYFSSEQGGACVYARGPYPPPLVQALPCDNVNLLCDEKANVAWVAPEDTGGSPITDYIIYAASPLPNGTYEVKVARTGSLSTNYTVVPGLVNFVPWFFKVSAISRLGYFAGYGRQKVPVLSAPSPAFVPFVQEPLQPVNGRAQAGNRQVWLAWDPPLWNGGRAISGYTLEILTADGTWTDKIPGLTNGAPPDGQYPIAAQTRSVAALSSTQRRLLLSQTSNLDPLSSTFHVTKDASGAELANAASYSFRLLAYSTFNSSLPSAVIIVDPVGTVASSPLNFTADCYEDAGRGAASTCTTGRAEDTRVTMRWSESSYNGDISILNYTLEYSTDGGTTWTGAVQLAVTSSGSYTYVYEGLTNDQAYMFRVRAVNFYGFSAPAVIGPLTPKYCPNLVECGVCVLAAYSVWGGCTMPSCILQDTEGRRLEILHDSKWGTITGATSQGTGLVACNALGLRGRPSTCYAPDGVCGAITTPATFPPDDGVIVVWLGSVSCVGTEAKVHDCSARTLPGGSKWTDAFYKLHSDQQDKGICCWPPLP